VIARARKFRKMLGGGTRQAGILAAAGLVALDQMIGRLAEDHARAKQFARMISELPGVSVGEIETNIVYFDVPCDAAELSEKLREAGLRLSATGKRRMRAVTHYGIDQGSVVAATVKLRDALAACAGND
jgi:threonine aldolase